jgi:hypothetical protein
VLRDPAEPRRAERKKEHFLFFHILGIIIPTDFHIFQDGFLTTNQKYIGDYGNPWAGNPYEPAILSWEGRGVIQ